MPYKYDLGEQGVEHEVARFQWEMAMQFHKSNELIHSGQNNVRMIMTVYYKMRSQEKRMKINYLDKDVHYKIFPLLLLNE